MTLKWRIAILITILTLFSPSFSDIGTRYYFNVRLFFLINTNSFSIESNKSPDHEEMNQNSKSLTTASYLNGKHLRFSTVQVNKLKKKEISLSFIHIYFSKCCLIHSPLVHHFFIIK